MTSYQYRKSHCGDKTILRPSYLHNGISFTNKMSSLYQNGLLHTVSPRLPVAPVAPLTPGSPKGPGAPRNPAGPLVPLSPVVPTDPTVPLSPVTPRGPRPPGSPVAPTCIGPREYSPPGSPSWPRCPSTPATPRGPEKQNDNTELSKTDFMVSDLHWTDATMKISLSWHKRECTRVMTWAWPGPLFCNMD